MLQDHANIQQPEVATHISPVGPTSHSLRYDLCPYAACCSSYEKMQKLSQHKIGTSQMVSETTSPITVCFGDEPSGSWWACHTRGRRGRGVIAGAVRHGQGAAPGRLLGGGTHD